MGHTDKTFRVHFTPLQERACTVRRRLAAGLLSAERGTRELVAILYADDYTACLVAARALGEYGDSTAILPLVETVLWADSGQRYFCRQLRCAAIHALERIGKSDDTATKALFATQWDPDPAVAEVAAAAHLATRSDDHAARNVA